MNRKVIIIYYKNGKHVSIGNVSEKQARLFDLQYKNNKMNKIQMQQGDFIIGIDKSSISTYLQFDEDAKRAKSPRKLSRTIKKFTKGWK